jgi:hypothetical protein
MNFCSKKIEANLQKKVIKSKRRVPLQRRKREKGQVSVSTYFV